MSRPPSRGQPIQLEWTNILESALELPAPYSSAILGSPHVSQSRVEVRAHDQIDREAERRAILEGWKQHSRFLQGPSHVRDEARVTSSIRGAWEVLATENSEGRRPKSETPKKSNSSRKHRSRNFEEGTSFTSGLGGGGVGGVGVAYSPPTTPGKTKATRQMSTESLTASRTSRSQAHISGGDEWVELDDDVVVVDEVESGESDSLDDFVDHLRSEKEQQRQLSHSDRRKTTGYSGAESWGVELSKVGRIKSSSTRPKSNREARTSLASRLLDENGVADLGDDTFENRDSVGFPVSFVRPDNKILRRRPFSAGNQQRPLRPQADSNNATPSVHVFTGSGALSRPTSAITSNSNSRPQSARVGSRPASAKVPSRTFGVATEDAGLPFPSNAGSIASATNSATASQFRRPVSASTRGRAKTAEANSLEKARTRGDTQCVFIVCGPFSEVRRGLLDRGWKENSCETSMFFDLKWTLYDNEVPYKSLRKDQMVNHFERNDEITTKVGLCRNMRNLRWLSDVDADTFYPRCYDVSDPSEMQSFIQDFRATNAEALVKRFSSMRGDIKGAIEIPRWCVWITRLSLSACRARLKMFCRNYDDIDSVQVAGTYLGLNDKDWESVCDLAESLSSDPDASWKRAQPPDGFWKGGSELVEDHELHEGCRALVKSMEKHSPQFRIDGESNVWIVKPTSSSKGVGIYCFNRLSQFMTGQGREAGRVVQKYVECPLLINSRKFDLRQWVLVTSWEPLTVFFYDVCLLRFCSDEFSLDDLDNRFRHLCNFSVNSKKKKAGGAQQEELMWCSGTFDEWLTDHFGDNTLWRETIQPSLKVLVLRSLQCGLNVVNHRSGSFELYGFDIVLDTDFLPWLIEINLSPDLRPTTDVKRRLAVPLVDELLKVVVDVGMEEIPNMPVEGTGPTPPRAERLMRQHGYDIGDWVLIYRGEEVQVDERECSDLLLMCTGTKLATRSWRVYEAAADKYTAAMSATKIQMHWRRCSATFRLKRALLSARRLQCSVRRSSAQRMHILRIKSARLLSAAPLRVWAHRAHSRDVCAVTLQAFVKRVLKSIKFRRTMAMMLLQAVCRRRLQSSRVIHVLSSVRKLQATFRGHRERGFLGRALRTALGMCARPTLTAHQILAKRIVAPALPTPTAPPLREVPCAFPLQPEVLWKCVVLEKDLKRLLKSLGLLLPRIRRRLARATAVKLRAVDRLQAALLRLEPRRILSISFCSILLQTRLLRACLRGLYGVRRTAAVSLQALNRRCLSRSVFFAHRGMSCLLGGTVRRMLTQSGHRKVVAAGRILSTAAGSQCLSRLWRVWFAGVVLASAARRSIAGKRMRKCFAPIVIAKHVLRFFCRRKFQVKKQALVTIVDFLWVRMIRRLAALTLQCSWRCRASKKVFRVLIEAKAREIQQRLLLRSRRPKKTGTESSGSHRTSSSHRLLSNSSASAHLSATTFSVSQAVRPLAGSEPATKEKDSSGVSRVKRVLRAVEESKFGTSSSPSPTTRRGSAGNVVSIPGRDGNSNEGYYDSAVAATRGDSVSATGGLWWQLWKEDGDVFDFLDNPISPIHAAGGQRHSPSPPQVAAPRRVRPSTAGVMRTTYDPSMVTHNLGDETAKGRSGVRPESAKASTSSRNPPPSFQRRKYRDPATEALELAQKRTNALLAFREAAWDSRHTVSSDKGTFTPFPPKSFLSAYATAAAGRQSSKSSGGATRTKVTR